MNKRRKKKVLLITGGIVIYILVAFIYTGYEAYEVFVCASHLKSIGSFFPSYQSDNKGKNPPDMNSLIEACDIIMPENLICPSEKDEIGR